MKKFQLIDDTDGSNVLGGDVGEDNVYVRAYGAVIDGEKQVSELAVGESTYKRYALSGQKPTVYRLLRVQ